MAVLANPAEIRAFANELARFGQLLKSELNAIQIRLIVWANLSNSAQVIL